MPNTKVKYDLSDRTGMFYWQTNRKISAEDMKTVFLDRRNTVSGGDTKAAIEYGMQQAGKSPAEAKVVDLGEPIPRGSVNNVLPATLADGTKVVVRMHPYYVQNGYFWAESVATAKAREVGVPTYETYFIDDSKAKFNFDFMIMEALPGKTLQDYWPIDPKVDKELMRETGRYAAMIHQVKPKGYGFFLNKVAKKNKVLRGQYVTFADHFYAGLEEDLRYLIDNEVFGIQLANNIESVFEKHKALLKMSRGSLIHNDIADWNQLSDGKKITGMVDWDECCSGDPVMEFSQWYLFFDLKRMRYFIEGYEEVSPLSDNFEEKLHLYNLRYLVSKMHLRKKRVSVVSNSKFLLERIKRGLEVMREEFNYFGLVY